MDRATRLDARVRQNEKLGSNGRRARPIGIRIAIAGCHPDETNSMAGHQTGAPPTPRLAKVGGAGHAPVLLYRRAERLAAGEPSLQARESSNRDVLARGP